MAIHVKMTNNARAVLRQMDENVGAALEAMGAKAENLILNQMRSGYGRPIRQTGDLMRDVQHEVNESNQTVTVGNTLNYAPHVHEGTHKMAGRPYIQDALTEESAIEQLKRVAEQNLKRGF